MIVTEMLNTNAFVLEKKIIPGGEDLGERSGIIRSKEYVSQANATPQNPAKGFCISYDGEAEFNNGRFRGRLEAEEGYFRGILETPALRSSTEIIYSEWRNYTAGYSAYQVSLDEAFFWGEATSQGWNRSYDVSGTIGGQSITRIAFWIASGRPIAMFASMTVTFANGNTQTYWDNAGMPSGGLVFRCITQGWNIQMRNLPTVNPRITNVIYRNGNQLMISTG